MISNVINKSPMHAVLIFPITTTHLFLIKSILKFSDFKRGFNVIGALVAVAFGKQPGEHRQGGDGVQEA